MQKTSTKDRPVVGVLACRKFVDPLWSHTVAEKYLLALDSVADVTPLLIPSLADSLDPVSLLQRLDGVLLPGSVSNIEPHHYQEQPVDDTDPRDCFRDNIALKLVRAALETGTPVLGICRGFQEINVAMGGSLLQRVEEEDGKLDHREVAGKELEEQFDLLAHEVRLIENGFLHRLYGKDRVRVNSLHGQGVKRLGEHLLVEAVADDGLIEAFRVDSDRTLILGVQWHPEWRTANYPFYSAIFRAFGEACRQHRI
ncbi:MAG: gamma-glutamyl-gamma-aminobutyrate hydrolase family protein [Gammaproteobacteria bacterium]|nr:gamma-glutamyl-gamma-aminobutyrate hydrolase family protein [Gammaproteobacteria bacterium]